MTKAQVEVITSVQRRRRWSSAEKDGQLPLRWNLVRLHPQLPVRLGLVPANCSAGGSSSANGQRTGRNLRR